MTTPTPADELRTAAATLRARIAQANAPLATTLLGGTRDLFGKTEPDRAVMHPGVGAALADWLEAEATSPVADLHSDACRERGCTINAALAVARQINGTP